MSKRGGGDELFKNLDRIARQRAAAPPRPAAAPDAPIVLLTPRWTAAIQTDPSPDPLAAVVRKGDGWELSVRMPVRVPDRPPGSADFVIVACPARVGAPDMAMLAQPGGGAAPGARCWGLRRLGPGTWLVAPPLPATGLWAAAFVVLCGVPEPAPFDGAKEGADEP